ncbi:polysaccharide deacetylase family protein [Cohnella suwonensis]|uniref:Polysaccharide deacetylase family protein n=1 Tax=Cohnella suwonensis TaxID=696072 RepID=A0ABW0LVF1_9BACL
MSQSRRATKTYYEKGAIVLTYHDINPNDQSISPYSLTPHLFSEHLDALEEWGFQIINMARFAAFMKEGQDIPPNALVITFDDGEKSFFTYAYPELKKRSLSATNFIVGQRIDADRGITWDQMREMKQHGFDFFSHTYNLHRNTNYGEDKRMLTNPLFLEKEGRLETEIEYERRIIEDLLLADKRINEELGEHTRILSFPFGSYNDNVIKICQKLGIELFFTVSRGMNYPNQVLAKRINAGDGALSAKGLIKEILRYTRRT